LKETEWDLIVCDEAHHLSPLRIYTLSTVKSEKIIFLSATLKRSIKASIEAVFKDKKFDIFTVSTQEAIDANILPEPKMFIHQLSLNSIDINQELVLRKGTRVMPIYCSWDNRWLMLKDEKFKDNSIICNCTEVQKYQWLCDQVNYWKKRFMNNSGAYYLKNKWMKAALDRKIFLGELKTGYVYKNIFSEIKKSERMICFCTSIDQANILGRHDSIGRYNSNSAIVHSKIKNVGKVIEVFQNKGINALFCVNMLREGMNLNEINTGVIVQLDGTELPFIQKLGRVLRADSPNVHIIYFKNTRDEEYLEKILNHIDSGYIKYIGV
jgi:superfamily II DNA or RNA helicase